MNKVLYDWYHALEAPDREALRLRFADSPVSLRIIAFLESSERNFKNVQAVRFLYEKELGEDNYLKLQNRWFKLRKKLLEAAQSSRSMTDDLMTEEETLYFHCRQLLRKKEIEAAKAQLETLEQRCWELNIFELLPDILHDLIYCAQVFQKYDEGDVLIKRLDDANQLRADIMRGKRWMAQNYQDVIRFGYSHIEARFEELKVLAEANPDYPRFTLMYHIYTMALGSDVNAMALDQLEKHQDAFTNLWRKHPEMPVESYRPNYTANTSAYVLGRQMAMYYIGGETEKARLVMLRYWDLLEEHQDFLRIGDRDMTNRIHLEIYSGHFKEALSTVKIFEEWILRHEDKEQLIKAHRWATEVYAFGRGQVTCDKVDFYYRKMKECIADDTNEAARDYGALHFVFASFCLMYGFPKEALNAVSSAPCKAFLEERGLSEVMEATFEIMSGDASEEKYPELKSKALALSERLSSDPTVPFYFRWAAGLLS